MAQHRAQDIADSYRILLTIRAFLQKPLNEVVDAAKGRKEADSNYRRLFSMVTHYGERPREEELKYLVLAMLIYRVLERTGYLGKGSSEEVTHQRQVSSIDVLKLVHNLIQIQDVNTHPVLAPDKGGAGSEVGLTKIGNAINVLIGSFVNHSCDPNTCRQGTKALSNLC